MMRNPVLKRNSQSLNLALSFLIMVGLNACVAYRPGSVKGGKKLYETFFLGEEGMQYFIKPLAFDNDEGNEVWVDFTFRHKNDLSGSTTINFSMFYPSNVKQIDSAVIATEQTRLRLAELSHMFTDKYKESFRCRFTSTSNLKAVKEVFEHQDWQLILFRGGDPITFQTPKKTLKSIQSLDTNLFEVL